MSPIGSIATKSMSLASHDINQAMVAIAARNASRAPSRVKDFKSRRCDDNDTGRTMSDIAKEAGRVAIR
jgi:hypothetical protein